MWVISDGKGEGGRYSSPDLGPPPQTEETRVLSKEQILKEVTHVLSDHINGFPTAGRTKLCINNWKLYTSDSFMG